MEKIVDDLPKTRLKPVTTGADAEKAAETGTFSALIVKLKCGI